MPIRHVCILGGTGFVGRAIVYRLARKGLHMRVLTRSRDSNRDMLVIPGIELIEYDSLDKGRLADAFAGMDAVINLVGILNENGHDGKGFFRVHSELAKAVINACAESGVRRLLHMSALNADASKGPSFYLRSKGEGENYVHTFAKGRVAVTSFRPSVIFGPGDSFFNRFAALLRFMPGLMPLACGNARFAPVYVGDVADRFVHALENKSTWGKHYDLCGPGEYSLLELVRYTARQAGLRRFIFSLPDSLSRAQAMLMEYLPGKPFSLDNYRSLKLDSVCSGEGRESTSIEAIVPGYLGTKNRSLRYDRYRKIARR